MSDTKKPICLTVTDIHIKSSNHKKIVELFKDATNEAKSLGVPLVCLGDFFDSRSSQRLDTLLAAKEIFEYIHIKGVEMFIIPGNHDKTLYESHNSFLDIYDCYSSIHLIRDTEKMNLSGVSVTFMPFFIEDMMVERLKSMEGTDILFSHFELNGSVNNGIVAKDRAITPKMLSQFKVVYLGHYHNFHKIEGTNVTHLSSILQNNFGEDDYKGFHVIYNDLSCSLIRSNFKPFKTLSLNLDTMTKEDEKEVLKMAKNEDLNLRVNITGSVEKMKAFKKDKFVLAGIDVKRKYKELTTDDVDYQQEQETDTTVDLKEELKVFCNKENLDFNKGSKYL